MQRGLHPLATQYDVLHCMILLLLLLLYMYTLLWNIVNGKWTALFLVLWPLKELYTEVLPSPSHTRTIMRR